MASTTRPSAALDHVQPKSRSNPYDVVTPLGRNGQSLEGILVGPRQPESLFDEHCLTFAPHTGWSAQERKRIESIYNRFGSWRDRIRECDEVEVESCFASLITSIHIPPRRDFARRQRLPKHVPTDRRDPIALMITSVQLLFDALPRYSPVRTHLDIMLLAYVRDRLIDAERVQVARNDLRFGALKLLKETISATIVKAQAECWAHVEVM